MPRCLPPVRLLTVHCLLFTILLLAACQPAPQTASPAATQPPGHATTRPTDHATTQPPDYATPTEAPLTLDELGIRTEDATAFKGVENAITRQVNEKGEVIYTTTIFYHNGEQKEVKYLIEQGTFDAHTEIYDDLTRPLTVEAYRLDENGEKIPVTLLWQGEKRGFREVIDLTGAFDPDLTQVDRHPYLHIVHGDRPIRSIDDLPVDDERLTALQSVRLEQAKAIRAIREFRDKFINNPDATITIEDINKYFDGSIFAKDLKQRLTDKINNGEKITEDDLYLFFSPKAVENWEKGGGLMLRFEFKDDGSKWVYLMSRSFTMNFYPLWFYTKDENGNIYHKMMIITLDADDVERYRKNQNDLTLLQGKWIIGENKNDVEVSPDNTYWQDLYRQNNPDFPFIILYAEGGDLTKTEDELRQEMTKKGIQPETQEKILAERARLLYLLSLGDNKAGETGFFKPAMVYVEELNPNDPLIETQPYANPLEPAFQLLELKFGVAVRISN